MYDKGAVSAVKQAFWTTFGQYMKPVLSAEGQHINWINYKTGIRHIRFRMEAFQSAEIFIEITHADLGLQELYFDQMLQLRAVLEEHVGEKWIWQPPTYAGNGKIYRELQDTSIMDRENWPLLISFFKPRMVALDAFWSEAKYAFEALE